MHIAATFLTLTLAAAPLAAQQPPAPPPSRATAEIERLRAELERLQRTHTSEQSAARVRVERLLHEALTTTEAHRENALTAARESLLHGSMGQALEQARGAAHAWGEFETRQMMADALSPAHGAFSGQEKWFTPGGLASQQPQRGTPEDSLYRVAREALNRGEYNRAAGLFRTFQERFPNARSAPSALYWRAFALYRAGSTEDLRTALSALEAQRTRYPTTAEDADASALRVRINSTLAARGDQQAAAAVRAASAQGTTCDREEMEVRAEALNALVRQDEAAAGPILGRVLGQRDECSTTLRRRAVYILGRRTDPGVASQLLDVARNDPDRNVRADAIGMLARMPGDQTVRVLEQLFTGSSDEHTQSAVFSALRGHNTPDARRVLRRYVERTDLSESLRANAVNALTGGSGWTVAQYAPAFISGNVVGIADGRSISTASPPAASRTGQRETQVVTLPPTSATRNDVSVIRPGSSQVELSEEDAAFLRGIYSRETSRVVKDAIINGLARAGGTANDQWLAQLARNDNEDMRYRSQALSRMRTQRFPIEEIVRLYDGMTDRELRSTLITLLGAREEDAATDKLFEIARSGTDPQTRRQAISALSRKKDPRTTRLLLELIER